MTLNQTGSVTLSVGTPYEETVGFYVNQTLYPDQLVLKAQPVFGPTLHFATDKYLVKLPTGKVTPNYLSSDNFKVAFIPGSSTGGPISSVLGPAGEPVILDRWGQVIQYFPRYGPVSNRTADSSAYASPNTSVAAGPLYGYTEPKSVDANSKGQYAIYDFRDAAPCFSPSANTSIAWSNPIAANSPTLYEQTWPDPTTTGNTFCPQYALQWMLGDTDASGSFQNAITGGAKLNYDGPYILVSAGPNGPDGTTNGFGNNNLGGFCNLVDGSGNPVQAAQVLKIFTNSENVYNFDHP